MNRSIKIKAITIDKFRSGGFTLLEILVALVIFALISVTCYKQIDASFRASKRIEQKYLALWMAESTLEEMFLDRDKRQMGETKAEYEILDSRWVVKTNTVTTEIDSLKRIDVSVYPDERDTDNAVLTMTRFIGEN